MNWDCKWFWRIWQWLTRPSPYLPPVPRDDNMRGLGWRGDRREVRPIDPKPEFPDDRP
jgi:hypothetical protein